MKRRDCELDCAREPEVTEAIRAGNWTAEIREHLLGCQACSEAVFVSQFLLADTAPASLPSAGVIWWKFQADRRRRAVRSIRLVETLTAAVALGAAVAIGAQVAGVTGTAILVMAMMAAASVAAAITAR